MMSLTNKKPPQALVQVRVQPRASRNQVQVANNSNCLRIKVTAPPVKGAANRACIELLAHALAVRKSDLAIVKGHQARDKVVQVVGLSEDEALRRIGQL